MRHIDTRRIGIDKGKPGVSRGRKATGLVPQSQSAGLPNQRQEV